MGVMVHRGHLHPKVDVSYIIGIDEVGRGCLAGDVYAAGVMAEESMPRIPGVDDSKKLTYKKREHMHEVLTHTPGLEYEIATRSAARIDEVGIVRAVFECFGEVAYKLTARNKPIKAIRIDGQPPRFPFPMPVPVEYIIKGDSLDWVIGAASIIAKVTRDAYMGEMDKQYPGYKWNRNMGYGARHHTLAIVKNGLTPLHRRRFCRKFLPQEKPEEVDSLIQELFGKS